MITGWLVKLVLGIALVGLVLFEVGSPLWTRAALDGAAHDTADAAARAYGRAGSGGADPARTELARGAAREEAEQRGATLTAFAVDPRRGEVRVTVFREARSVLMHRFDQTKGFYEVSVEATSDLGP